MSRLYDRKLFKLQVISKFLKIDLALSLIDVADYITLQSLKVFELQKEILRFFQSSFCCTIPKKRRRNISINSISEFNFHMKISSLTYNRLTFKGHYVKLDQKRAQKRDELHNFIDNFGNRHTILFIYAFIVKLRNEERIKRKLWSTCFIAVLSAINKTLMYVVR
jgi:hypothetical protein